MINILSPREAAWEFSFDPTGVVPAAGGGQAVGARRSYLALLWAEHQRSLLDAAAARRQTEAFAAERVVLDLYRIEADYRRAAGLRAAAVETVLLAEL